jgi:hypothetical protein
MRGEGVNELLQAIDKRIRTLTDKSPVLDFGEITSDMSLVTNYFPVPIPQRDYTVCRSVQWGAVNDVFYRTQDVENTNSGEHTHSDGGSHSHPLAGEATHTHIKGGEKEQHVHDVLIGPKFRWLVPGDRVLVAWVGVVDEDRDAVVVDIICPASRIRQSFGNSAGNEGNGGMYTVTFNSGGATGTLPMPITQSVGQAVTLPGQGSLKNGEAFFNGWKSGEENNVHIEGDTPTFSDNVELTAQWIWLVGGV